MKYDEMSVNELYELYQKKYAFIKGENLPELISLKKECPEIFMEENEKAFKELVETTEFLMQMPHLQAKMLAEKKKRLVPMDYEQWKIGMVDEKLADLRKIGLDDMLDISRSFVKESIIQCQSICLQYGFDIDISLCFPLLSYLMNEILVQFPLDKRSYQLKASLFKIRGGKENLPANLNVSQVALSEWENEVLKHSAIKADLETQFRATFKKIRMKFNARPGFYEDALFFCLLEVSEFIGLLIPTLGNMNQGRQVLMIKTMMQMISITELSHVIVHPFVSKEH